MTLRNLSQDSLDLSAAFGFVRVEAMPACRHTGFSATHGGIVSLTIYRKEVLNAKIVSKKKVIHPCAKQRVPRT